MNDLRQITCTLEGPSETKRRNKTSRREFFFEVIYEEEVTMTKILSLAAIAGLLMASSPAVLAASETSTRTPGHKMQVQHPNPIPGERLAGHRISLRRADKARNCRARLRVSHLAAIAGTHARGFRRAAQAKSCSETRSLRKAPGSCGAGIFSGWTMCARISRLSTIRGPGRAK